LGTPAVNPAAFIPVEPTPAVRTQLLRIICLGDLLETVAFEMSLTTNSLRCRNQFVGASFFSCSANKGELIGLPWQKCVARQKKGEASTGCTLTPQIAEKFRSAAGWAWSSASF
jgi:hypothetical protein